MSVVGSAVRAAIERRADFRCEYCHLPTRGQVGTFPIDHVLPRSAGGVTSDDNLALACPHCNARKWAHTSAVDPATGEVVPLFNPRTNVWADHFQWSAADPALLDAKTATGRATVALLELNQPNLVDIRRLLMELGLFPGHDER